MSDTVSRNALVILAVIAAGAAIYWLRDILTPLALAVFLAVMIDGFARVLDRRLPMLPRPAALPVAIILSITLFGVAAFVIAENATGFVTQLISYTPRINGLIAQVGAMFNIDVPPTVDQLFAKLDPARYLGEIARGLQGFASDAVFILIYLGFIIASRRGFERKIVGLFPEREERQEAMAAFHRIRDGVEQYLWVQTVTGLMIGVGSWAVMMAVGLDNALFWAFLIFIASYIPIVGGLVGILAPPIFALVQFPTYWPAVSLLVALYVIQFIVGNVIQPRMQGRSLNMDPVVVLLALAFWGAVWGAVGMFLSTPLTVMAMVILAQFGGTRWVAVLLSADGEPDRLRTHPETPSGGADRAAEPGEPDKAPPRRVKRP
jgi:predicted PurR-regulated permease PerM